MNTSLASWAGNAGLEKERRLRGQRRVDRTLDSLGTGRVGLRAEEGRFFSSPAPAVTGQIEARMRAISAFPVHLKKRATGGAMGELTSAELVFDPRKQDNDQ